MEDVKVTKQVLAQRRWRARNLEKAREMARKSAKKRRDAGKATKMSAEERRNYHTKARYGLTSADVDLLLRRQEGKCALCKRVLVRFGNRRTEAQIDHCHDSGVVRGVLCGGCNRGLGSFEDNAEALEAAARYVSAFAYVRSATGR